MDYKARLSKRLKTIPSSQNRQRARPKINYQHKWSSLISQNPAGHEWPNLPPDLIVLIMQRIGWYDVLKNLKRVCKYWYVLSKDPSIWRVIEFREDVLAKKLREDMGIRLLTCEEYVTSQKSLPREAKLDYSHYEANIDRKVEKALHEMVRHVIDLSCGQLHDLCIQNFGSNNLFKYIYQRYVYTTFNLHKDI